jgi:hypothetical protein
MKERLELLARQLKSSPSPGAVQQIGEELEKLAAQLPVSVYRDSVPTAAKAHD